MYHALKQKKERKKPCSASRVGPQGTILTCGAAWYHCHVWDGVIPFSRLGRSGTFVTCATEWYHCHVWGGVVSLSRVATLGTIVICWTA